ncbi:sigma-70 family RNA polymerase sigma factor [uncultured Maribacter sp.]|uniref:RNA polymerase sigma factor n=1 Tax=uncultured Maribacter sp. TaxID=431308 RepID=UPI00260652AB|nr:sigma-70 family RNA polymerase sigma factor [uncultured Maribacter sp.]
MNEEELIKKSLDGDRKSLEELINSVRDSIFNMSIRFLYSREDSEDATQEILIKIVTNLSKFKAKSKFKTWTYRIATNYLINLKKTKIEQQNISFDYYANDLKTFIAPKDYNLPDKNLLEKEMKTNCTLAMLQCLNREHRIAFILGSILKIKSNVGAEITNTSSSNFRKKVEKSRKLIGNFMNNNCGVYNPKNPCRCNARINTGMKCGRIKRGNLQFLSHIELYNEEMEELHSLTGIYQNHGSFESKLNFNSQLSQLIASKKIMN